MVRRHQLIYLKCEILFSEMINAFTVRVFSELHCNLVMTKYSTLLSTILLMLSPSGQCFIAVQSVFLCCNIIQCKCSTVLYRNMFEELLEHNKQRVKDRPFLSEAFSDTGTYPGVCVCIICISYFSQYFTQPFLQEEDILKTT